MFRPRSQRKVREQEVGPVHCCCCLADKERMASLHGLSIQLNETAGRRQLTTAAHLHCDLVAAVHNACLNGAIRVFPLVQLLLVVRHGESEYNQAVERSSGFADPSIFDPRLTARGIKQVRARTSCC
jgi:hypothetical protein